MISLETEIEKFPMYWKYISAYLKLACQRKYQFKHYMMISTKVSKFGEFSIGWHQWQYFKYLKKKIILPSIERNGAYEDFLEFPTTSNDKKLLTTKVAGSEPEPGGAAGSEGNLPSEK